MRIAQIALVTALAGLVSSCGGTAPPAAAPASSPSPAAPAGSPSGAVAGSPKPSVAGASQGTGRPITVPYVVTLTGQFAQSLVKQRDAVHLAVKDFNAAGGLDGRPFQLEEADDAGTPQGAIEAVRKFLPSAVFILSSTPTNSAQGSFPVANQARVPIYGPAVTVSTVLTGNRPWTFTGTPDIGAGVSTLAKEFKKAHASVKKLSMVLDTGDAAAKSQGGLLRDALQAESFQIEDAVTVTTSQLDFAPVLDKIRAQKPDAVILGVESPTAAGILKQEQTVGLRVPNVAPRVGWDPGVVPKIAPAASLADFWTFEFFDPKASPAGQKFEKEYTEASGRAVDDTAAFGYESVFLLADLLRGINVDASGAGLEAERQKLQSKLENLKAYKSLYGELSFSNGIAARPVYVLQGNAQGQLEILQTNR